MTDRIQLFNKELEEYVRLDTESMAIIHSMDTPFFPKTLLPQLRVPGRVLVKRPVAKRFPVLDIICIAAARTDVAAHMRSGGLSLINILLQVAHGDDWAAEMEGQWPDVEKSQLVAIRALANLFAWRGGQRDLLLGCQQVVLFYW
jgi:hypothetical protein